MFTDVHLCLLLNYSSRDLSAIALAAAENAKAQKA